MLEFINRFAIYFIAAGTALALWGVLPLVGMLWSPLGTPSAHSFFNTILVWVLAILLYLTGAIPLARAIAHRPVAPGTDDSARVGRWNMYCHLGALAGYLIPFGHVSVPLIIWATRRDRVTGVDDNGRKSLNFQFTVTLLVLIALMLCTLYIGFVLLPLLLGFHLTMTLYMSTRTYRGGGADYSLCIRIIPATPNAPSNPGTGARPR